MLNYFIGIIIILIIIIILMIFILIGHQKNITVDKIHGDPNNTYLIHRSWSSRTLNQYMYHYCYKTWIDLNPYYTMIWYDDYDCEKFMKKFGEKEYQAWKKIIHTAYKSDLWRACLLYHYGGVYIDCYTRPYMPIDDMIKLTNLKDQHYFISAQDFKESGSGIHNGFMIASKNHPFLRAYIDQILYNVNKGVEKRMFELTGPLCLSKTIKKVNKQSHHIGFNNGKYNYYLFSMENTWIANIMHNNIKLMTKKYDYLYCLLYQKVFKQWMGSNTSYYYHFLNHNVVKLD
jgi:mannosyltransferase OCH1-like enzyme